MLLLLRVGVGSAVEVLVGGGAVVGGGAGPGGERQRGAVGGGVHFGDLGAVAGRRLRPGRLG